MRLPKSMFAMTFMALVLTGCTTEDSSSFWTVERCNERLVGDVEDYEEQQTTIGKNKKTLEDAERRGNTATANQIRTYIEDGKKTIRILLAYYDNEFTRDCGKHALDQSLVARTEAARQFLANEGQTTAVVAEDMPDLRVTKIESVFIPVEFDQSGGCSGPYLDLTYTVSNQGGDFPRPVDLEEYTRRAQVPSEQLEFFNVYGELDFGNDSRTSADFDVRGGEDGMIKKGGALKLKKKVRVEHNQTHAKAWGYVQSSALLKNAGNTVRHETEIGVPIWDVYTESHDVIDGIDPDTKKYYIATRGTVSNKGQTPTPGPIRGSFVVYDAATRQKVVSWSGETKGAVAGSEQILARTYSTVKVPTTMYVETSVVPVCPEGTSGSLADGDTKNNRRELNQQK